MTGEGGHGMLLDEPGATVLDTRTLPWLEHVGIPGGSMQVLARDQAGHPSVLVTWLPPGLRAPTPERHYHGAVRERGYVLDGELPIVEYAGLDDSDGVLVVFRAGWFMDRAPGCVHGLAPAGSGPVGFTMLEWRSGPGTYLTEPIAASETVVLPATGNAGPVPPPAHPGAIIERPDLTLLDTRELPWQPVENGALRPLTRRRDGTPDTCLHWLAPGEPGRPLPVPAERALVLAGSVDCARPTRAPVAVPAGGFVDLRDPAWRLCTGDAPTGGLVLAWGDPSGPGHREVR